MYADAFPAEREALRSDACRRGPQSAELSLHTAAVDAPLVALHNRLREMHNLFSLDSDAFQASYNARAKEIAQLAEAANYRGYAMRQGEAPCALHYAAGCGCLEACAGILRQCERLNFVADTAGQTALFWAAQSGLRSTVSLLMQHGADVAHVDCEGRTPLHLAAANGFPLTCSLLLAASGGSCGSHREPCLDLQTLRQGEAPLHLAARCGHAAVVDLLLSNAADPSVRTLQGRTPLHLAAMAGHSLVSQRLLEVEKPDVQPPMLIDLSDRQGMRALEYAEEGQWSQAARVLAKEERAQDDLRLEWRTRFEPRSRAFLNVPMCDAFLEIGRPEILSVEHVALRLECRVIDAMGLIDGYFVEVSCACGGSEPLAVEFCRRTDQEPIDDVEFRVPKFVGSEEVWTSGSICRFRVRGRLQPTPEARAAHPCSSVDSAWSLPSRIPSCR